MGNEAYRVESLQFRLILFDLATINGCYVYPATRFFCLNHDPETAHFTVLHQCVILVQS